MFYGVLLALLCVLSSAFLHMQRSRLSHRATMITSTQTPSVPTEHPCPNHDGVHADFILGSFRKSPLAISLSSTP